MNLAGKKINLPVTLAGRFFRLIYILNPTNGEPVAVKVEPDETNAPQLIFEYKIYNVLAGGVGIPRVEKFCREHKHNILVMDLLGPSLEDMFDQCNRIFSLKTVVTLARQLLDRIEFIHNNGLVHRDMKPDNMLLGLGDHSDVVFIIDFGLAKMYRDVTTGRHIPYRTRRGLTGTARYCSIHAHLGLELSRRDDLESLGYILVYFLRGGLPWMGLSTKKKDDKNEQIHTLKSRTATEVLCTRLPEEFATYMKYVKGLAFEELPDYVYLKQLFDGLDETLTDEYMFDWKKEITPTM